MKNVISCENMRASDKYVIDNFKSSKELMYNAALGVFNNVNWKGKIGIVVGSGNNAGDGYALSIILKKHNINSDLILVEEKFSIDGEYYFNKAKEENINHLFVDEVKLSSYDILVDALLGTGFKGTPKEQYASTIKRINESNAYVVSIDINSGLNANNGLANIAIKSDLTISIGQYKYGHFLNMGMDYCNKVINVDIDIPPLKKEAMLLENEDVKSFFTKRKHFSNKGVYGYVGIIGGSSLYPGAVKLASLGQNALYAGAGVSKIIVPKSISSLLYPHVLEATIFPMPINEEGNMAFDETKLNEAIKSLKAIALGVGWGKNEENKKILTYLLNNVDIPLIIDADGLNVLSEIGLDILNNTKARVILTPHLKEFSRLSLKTIEEIENDMINIVNEFVKKYPITLLLKGPTTIVADSNKMYLINKGTPGMAVAGSGDVLSGILLGTLGQKQDDITYSIAVGAYINGLAGEYASKEYGEVGMVSSDTARCVSKVIKDL